MDGASRQPKITGFVWLHADGMPAGNCLYVCTAAHLFGDPSVGAVQIDVRMSNRGVAPPDGNKVRRIFRSAPWRTQDLEFRTAIAAIQMSLPRRHRNNRDGWQRPIDQAVRARLHRRARRLTTRRARYSRISNWASTCSPRDGRPDLASTRTSIRKGCTACAGSSPSAPAGARARCSAPGTPAGSTSPHLSTFGAAEMLYYLAQPWMQLLGSVVYPFPFVLLAVHAEANPGVGVSPAAPRGTP